MLYALESLLSLLKVTAYGLWIILLIVAIAFGGALIVFCVLGFFSELVSTVRSILSPLPHTPDRTLDHTKTFPVKDHEERIAWSVATYVHEEQKRRGVSAKPLKLVKREGGYSIVELDEFYPLWRSESDLIKRLQKRVEALEHGIIDHLLKQKLGAMEDQPDFIERDGPTEIEVSHQKLHRRAQQAESRVLQLEKEVQRLKNGGNL